MATPLNAQDEGAAEIASEVTPLLANQISDSERARANDVVVDDDDRPLPKGQLTLLCIARVVEPIAFFSIFPFVNQMVKNNGNLGYGEVGFYSGLIESLFSLTQMIVMIFWGRASDRYGRKPILVISLYGVSVCMGAFGLSKTIWQMIMFRCLAGSFAGVVVTMRTMFAEISTPKTQARAFSWFAFTSNIGIFVGPLLGGALAEPAKQYPKVFGNMTLFKEFPFFLPTLVIGVLGFIVATITMFFVKETLVRDVPGGDAENGASKPPPMTMWELVKAPGVATVLAINAYTMTLAYSYTAVVPVYYFTPVSYGGFGFSELLISAFMGLTGFSQAVWLLLFFPPLHRRIGTVGTMKLCAGAYPIFFAIYPALNLVLRSDTDSARTFFWIVSIAVTMIGTGVSMAFTGAQLSLNDISPTPQVLGTLNALALTINSGLRAFSPALFTSLLAVGVQGNILKGQLIWLILFVVAVGFTFSVRYLPDGKNDKRLVRNDGNMSNEESTE